MKDVILVSNLTKVTETAVNASSQAIRDAMSPGTGHEAKPSAAKRKKLTTQSEKSWKCGICKDHLSFELVRSSSVLSYYYVCLRPTDPCFSSYDMFWRSLKVWNGITIHL